MFRTDHVSYSIQFEHGTVWRGASSAFASARPPLVLEGQLPSEAHEPQLLARISFAGVFDWVNKFSFLPSYTWFNSQRQSFALADRMLVSTQFMIRKGSGGAADRQTVCLSILHIPPGGPVDGQWPTPYNQTNTIVADSSTTRPPIATDIEIDAENQLYAFDSLCDCSCCKH